MVVGISTSLNEVVEALPQIDNSTLMEGQAASNLKNSVSS